MVLKSTWTST